MLHSINVNFFAKFTLDDTTLDMSIEEMQQIIPTITTTQELVDVYVNVQNKFWIVEYDLYNHDEGTEELERGRTIVEAWGDMIDGLVKRVMETASKEGILTEREPNYGMAKELEVFMDKYDYRNGCGWRIKK